MGVVAKLITISIFLIFITIWISALYNNKNNGLTVVVVLLGFLEMTLYSIEKKSYETVVLNMKVNESSHAKIGH